MNNTKKIGLKVVGYYSFAKKKMYKTKAALKAAESRLDKKLRLKVELIKKEIQILKNYVSNVLTKMKGSFTKWSESKEIKRYVKLAKAETPKQYRHLINYNVFS